MFRKSRMRKFSKNEDDGTASEVSGDELYGGGSDRDEMKIPVPAKKGKKGRPRKYPLGTGVPYTGPSYTGHSSVKGFEGLTLVYRCPFVHCSRFYATKLALRRHFGVYIHVKTCDEIDAEYLTHGIVTEEQKLNLIRSMPRVHKCPLIDCEEKFTSLMDLCLHFNDSHHPVNNPASPNLRIRNNVPVHDLMDWTEMYEDCLGFSMAANYDLGSIVPDMYNIREDKMNWRLVSIFECIGPRPSIKRIQMINSLRELLQSSYTPSNNNVIIVDENALRLMVMLALTELMPKGFLLSRDYYPSHEDEYSHPAYDEEYLRTVAKESVLSMLKFGAVHSSRNYLRKMRLKKTGECPEEDMEDGETDRFVCQVPGCRKVFASLPAYKYHMNHFEHDLEALLVMSMYIHYALFSYQNEDVYGDHVGVDQGLFNGNTWCNYEQLVLKFVSTPSNIHLATEDDEALGSIPQVPIPGLIYSVNDVVHLLHGYIDQQLPVVFSWNLMRKRDVVHINPITNEFSLTIKRNDNVCMIRRGDSPDASSPMEASRKRRPKRDPGDRSVFKKGGLVFDTEKEHHCTNRMYLGTNMRYLTSDQIYPYQQNKVVLQVASISNTLDGECSAWLDYSFMSSYEEDVIDVSSEQVAPSVKTPHLIVRKNTDEIPTTISLLAFSTHRIDDKNFVLFNNGGCISSMDWFPYAHPLGNDMFVFSLATSNGVSLPEVYGGGAEMGLADDCILLWNVVLRYSQDQTSIIEQVKLNKILKPKRETPSHFSIKSLRWYPFVVSAENNENQLNGLLGVLSTSGEIDIYVFPKQTMFSAVTLDERDCRSGMFQPPIVSIKEVGRISIESYHISCFCWNKQQSVSTSGSLITTMTTQIILGTKEGYIGVCDLSIPSSPQMVTLIPGHEKCITSIDWSPVNPAFIVTSSFDGSVLRWNLSDMHHYFTLAKAKGPFLSVQWVLTCSKPFDQIGSGTLGMGDGWDSVDYVLAMDDYNHGKLISIKEPGKLIPVSTSSPRMWTSIYGNGRHEGCLFACIGWEGRFELLGSSDPKSKNWNSFVVSDSKYDQYSNTCTIHYYENDMAEQARDLGSEKGKEALGYQNGYTCIVWHPLPIGLVASASSMGLVQLHLV